MEKDKPILPQISLPFWLLENSIVNEKNQLISFKDHLFLYDLYRDFSPRQVIKKAAQIGVSTMMILKALWMARYKRYNTIYTLPSDSDVWEFVPTKADKIIQANACLRQMLKVDKVELKEIADRFIHFKGTRSKTAPIMTTADLLIHDEKDRSDQTILDQYSSRISRSEFKGVWNLSNPSITNAGVDLDWKDSDQKEWHITCLGCKQVQYLAWADNVDEARAEFVCKSCQKVLTPQERRRGKWIAMRPGKEVSGYHISQIMAPWLSAKDLMREKENSEPDTFANFVLGEPFSHGDVEDFRQLITDCWTPKALDKEPFYMGVDVGKIKHYVVGSMQGIFKIGQVESRQELQDLIERYNPIVVMDAGPERTWAEEFKQKYPKLFINFYKRDKDRAEILKWGQDEDWGIVYSDRNRLIDKVIDELMSGNILFSLENYDLQRFISHWVKMRRVREEDAQGMDRFVWEKPVDGMDHYVHALCYYYIARERLHETTFIPETTPKKDIIVRTATGFKMLDLEEIINNR